jgi:hypothetical protein
MFHPSTLTLSLFHGTIPIAREMALARWVPMVSAIRRHGHQADANAAPTWEIPYDQPRIYNRYRWALDASAGYQQA